MKNPFKYLLFAALILAVGIFWMTLSAPGVNDLPGNFREIDAWQNENNTGPVNRVYIVTVSDTLWRSMEDYGNYMPYSKLGTTNVYFFLEDQPYPSKITPGEVPFSAVYQKACVGRYYMNHMKVLQMIKHPFRD